MPWQAHYHTLPGYTILLHMSTLRRLLIFLGAIGVVFVAAAAAGTQFGGHGSGDERGHGTGGHARSGTGHESPGHVPGLAVSEDGLTLELEQSRAPLGEPFGLAFSITGADGRPVQQFDVEHTKRMHLIVVRRDMTGFQHLHPRERDGRWSTSVELAEPGTYRVFADFSTGGEKRVLAADLQVDGAVTSAEAPATELTQEVDGYSVSLNGGALTAGETPQLRFDVTRNGEAVELAEYLGARGHLVALRSGDLGYLHVHPADDSLSFEAQFPSAGRYGLFLQFVTAGSLHTVPFTVEVSR